MMALSATIENLTLFRPSHRTAAITAAFACVVLNCPAASTNTNTFGFTGPEIYPIDSQISQLHVAHLDGDGLNALIVVNNSREPVACECEWSLGLPQITRKTDKGLPRYADGTDRCPRTRPRPPQCPMFVGLERRTPGPVCGTRRLAT